MLTVEQMNWGQQGAHLVCCHWHNHAHIFIYIKSLQRHKESQASSLPRASSFLIQLQHCCHLVDLKGNCRRASSRILMVAALFKDWRTLQLLRQWWKNFRIILPLILGLYIMTFSLPSWAFVLKSSLLQFKWYRLQSVEKVPSGLFNMKWVW